MANSGLYTAQEDHPTWVPIACGAVADRAVLNVGAVLVHSAGTAIPRCTRCGCKQQEGVAQW